MAVVLNCGKDVSLSLISSISFAWKWPVERLSAENK